ncbi:MAG: thioredoxin family protein [Carboxylicivirga sp.]|jgi:thiol:disulfide interchange protein|nr:thioredoxin family protein [Carboxylicivirga sp.]MCT4643441.1 thioredoxin family protein [Carboxylicivirga sp.]
MRIIITIAMLVVLSVSASAQGIKFFEGSYAEAQAKAQAEGKAIFMDFYTAWCGPCKMMAKKYFTLETVGSVYNTKYICLKVDAEKGEGPKLAKKYGVNAYPTLVYAKADGTPTNVVKGAKNEEELLNLAK